MTATAIETYGLKERTEPQFVKFEVGDVVEGVLTRIDTVEVGDKKQRATRYTVENVNNRDLFSFLGSYQIDVKLRPNDVGHFIQVEYIGDDQQVKRNGNAMKMFKVLVSERPIGNKLADGTFITNDDVAF